MVEGVDIVPVLWYLGACTTALDEHTVESLGIAGVAWTPKGNADDGDWFAHCWLRL